MEREVGGVRRQLSELESQIRIRGGLLRRKKESLDVSIDRIGKNSEITPIDVVLQELKKEEEEVGKGF